MEWIFEYGLFLSKVITVVIALAVLIFMIVGRSGKAVKKGQLQLIDLNEEYRLMKNQMQQLHFDKFAQKQWNKQEKKKIKEEAKLKKKQAKEGVEEKKKECIYVIDFRGSMDAHEVSSLREEVTAILSVAAQNDQVLLRLESPGGAVHGYGLAASQLCRLKERNIHLTVAVDKVAASGGYMMACVADKIVSAPFAILGSIGVVAQIPNFHRLLKKNDIDIELHTAGEYKRTLTLLGENTEQGREKFRQELNQIHELFKQFIAQNRPTLDLKKVATGEHWLGTQALELGLIDQISTSDDLLLSEFEGKDVIKIQFIQRKRLLDRLVGSSADSIDKLLQRWWQKGQKPLY